LSGSPVKEIVESRHVTAVIGIEFPEDPSSTYAFGFVADPTVVGEESTIDSVYSILMVGVPVGVVLPLTGKTPAESIAGATPASNSRLSSSSTHGFTLRPLLLIDVGLFRHARVKKRRSDFIFIEAASRSYKLAMRSNKSVTKPISSSKPLIPDDRVFFYQPDIKAM
jgi:hypothetical protein